MRQTLCENSFLEGRAKNYLFFTSFCKTRHHEDIIFVAFFLYFFRRISKQNMSETLLNGDTAYMLICMALVNLMTPGLAFFYGGLVRSSNVLSIMAHGGMFFFSLFSLFLARMTTRLFFLLVIMALRRTTRKRLLLTFFFFFFFFFFFIVFEKTGIRYVSESLRAISSATRNRIIS